MARVASVAAVPIAPAPRSRKARLRAALAVTLVVLVLEVVGGFVSRSLSLVADANHMLADVAALTLAYAATMLAGRAPTSRHTFGLARAEVLAAFVNAQLLLLVCGWLLFETLRRFRDPAEIRLSVMIPVALLGLAANLISLAILAPDRRNNLNVRAAYLEVLMDSAGSLGVLAAGFGIARTGWAWLDPLVSGLIAVLVFPRAVNLLRQSAHILLEGTPVEIDVDLLRTEILELPGVEQCHDLHFWTLSSGSHSASVHIRAASESESGQVLEEVQALLLDRAGVEHATVQVESGPERECRTAPDHA
ncbi:MAG: cation diffusion facilitator family transporter [Acidobacteriota bacterium]